MWLATPCGCNSPKSRWRETQTNSLVSQQREKDSCIQRWRWSQKRTRGLGDGNDVHLDPYSKKYLCVREILLLIVCGHMCMCVEYGKRENGLRWYLPCLWGRSLTTLNRLDRLLGEHRGLADLHHLKLGLQTHATMASFLFLFLFFSVASVAWTQVFVICQHFTNKAISSPAPSLLLLLFFLHERRYCGFVSEIDLCHLSTKISIDAMLLELNSK